MTAAPDQPRLSVVLPTRDRAERLSEAIASVLAQTFPSFELLVVDDASGDRTPEVVAAIGDPRVRYLRRETSGGAAAARNHGIRHARGELVAFLDDDDAYLPEFLESFDRAFAAAPAETGFGWCGARVVAVGPEGPRVRLEAVWQPEVETREEAYRLFLVDRKVGTNGGLVVRREILEEVGGFDEGFSRAEDTDLLVRLARKADFLVVPRVLMVIHEHQGPRLTVYDVRMAEAYDRLIEKNRAALETRPDLYFELLYKATWLYYHGGDRRRGRARWAQAFRRRPFHPRAWLSLPLFEILGTAAPAAHRQAARLKRGLLRRLGR